jgi:4-amino-4-deoxy-L-arabinose transferase-like glycosyltransferase
VSVPVDSPTAAASTRAAGARQGAAPSRRRPRIRWAWVAALLLLAAALVVRLEYVGGTADRPLVHDALDYDAHAVSIAQGEGYSKTLAHGRPTAFRPPVYPYLLGGVYKVAGVERAGELERVHVARVAQAVIGVAVVGMIGLLAAQLWGAVAALVATALATVYVPLVTMSGTVMSEPLFVVLMLACLVAALRHRASPHRWRWALVAGVLAGLAILTRANALILLLPLALAVWDRPRRSWRALGPPVALVVMAVLVVTPWTIRNAVTLHAFVPVSTQLGSALAGTYNDQARTDPRHPGSWRSLRHVPEYADLYGRIRQIPEADLERALRRRSVHYAAHHPAYVAQVAFWTTVRGLELDGRDWARHTASTVSIDTRWADRGVLCFWVFAVLALAGAATRLARRPPAFVWAFPALMYLSVVFLVIETPRYRTPMDPFIVLLAALALVAGGGRLARLARR